jgi:hypothetical protein
MNSAIRHGVFACLLYLALWDDLQWAENIAVFFVWFYLTIWGLFAFAFALVLERGDLETANKGYADIPGLSDETVRNMNFVVEISFCAIMIGAGWFATSIAGIGATLIKRLISCTMEDIRANVSDDEL